MFSYTVRVFGLLILAAIFFAYIQLTPQSEEVVAAGIVLLSKEVSFCCLEIYWFIQEFSEIQTTEEYKRQELLIAEGKTRDFEKEKDVEAANSHVLFAILSLSNSCRSYLLEIIPIPSSTLFVHSFLMNAPLQTPDH